MDDREPLNCGGENCWRTETASHHDDATCPTYNTPSNLTGRLTWSRSFRTARRDGWKDAAKESKSA